MRTKILFLIVSAYLMGCAAYKELKPDPKVISAENGYIEIKDGDENFELKKDKKYFMKFPSPPSKNFYLVLNIDNKDLMQTYLTPFFDDGKGEIVRINDQSTDPLKISYYALDNSVQNFYWVIEAVKYDIILRLDYRYVPQWRYQFETKYAQFQETLLNNKSERSAYQGIGIERNMETVDLKSEISALKDKTSNLKLVEKELQEIERIFPPDIINTTDEAYQNYRQIKVQVEDEIKFQNDYMTTLNIFDIEKSSRQNHTAFVASVPEFNSFFKQKERFPDNVLGEAKRLIMSRFSQLVPSYEKEVAAKRDIEPISFDVDGIKELYAQTGESLPENVSALLNFVSNFNQQSEALKAVSAELKAIDHSVRSTSQMPSNTFFTGIITKASKLKYTLPNISAGGFGKYQNYACTQKLSSELQSLNTKINQALDNYRAADRIVPQVNAFREEKQYGNMIRLLNQNTNLDFLIDMYAQVDQLSLDQQTAQIRSSLYTNDWSNTETSLRTLHLDENFLKPAVIRPQKTSLVKSLEDTLFNRISSLSKQNARQLMENNLRTLSNISALYSDPAFEPVYNLTFSSGSPTDLERKKLLLRNDLNFIKDQQFPGTAIRQLYSEFVQNPADNGVLKARAIVSHSSQYKGSDQQIKTWAGECDPWASKWITKAKDYRKVFALPTNSEPSASNQYVFRLNIRIPSEAQFPVYDISVKLPKEMAQDASTEQWYESIFVNKDPIKNEGRYTITAPTAANDYECQIGPVRMLKEQDNVLEIRFRNPKFKVYEVSVMAQKPIIKKN